jgi:hypothetical protein
MRSLWFIILASLVPTSAWPCAQPPPTRSELVLLTATDATLPGDGAILVTRRDVKAESRFEPDVRWTVKDAAGHVVALQIEDLGSGIERWHPTSPADRELVIRDPAGKLVAKLHQTRAKAKSAALDAPRAKRLESTTTIDDVRKFTDGVPGSATSLELAQDAPADAKYLVIAVTGTGAYAHSALAPKPSQHTFEWSTYAHKNCMHVGPAPILVGQQVALTWIDSLGRRSPATEVTVEKLVAHK